MRCIRLGAVLAALALAPACGSGTGTSATRSSVGAAALGPPSPALPAPAAQLDPTSAAAAAPATGPPVKAGTAAVGAPPTTTRATVTPAPPPPAAVVNARPAAVATAVGGGTTVTLRVAPGEQYRGELFHATVEVAGPTAIRSIQLDLGNGSTVDVEPSPAWGCPNGSRQVMAGPPAHAYAAPGRYTVTALVTVVPCVYVPGQTGVVMPWVASGPEKAIQARADLTQRADLAPPS